MPDPERRTLQQAADEEIARGRIPLGLLLYDPIKDKIRLCPVASLHNSLVDAILRKFDISFTMDEP